MGKRRKDPPVSENTENDVKSKENSSSSTIFKSLFGREETSANSVFSDSNPFRRKNVESQQQDPKIDLGVCDIGVNEGNFESLAMEQQDKSGKVHGKRESSDLETEVVVKKKKKKKLKGHREKLKGDEDESNERGVDHEMVKNDISSDILVQKKKKKKREELEAEYDARHYGVTSEPKEDVEKGTKIGRKRSKIDNQEDIMMPKEGFDDESKLKRTIFVGNFPLTLKKKEILKVFEKFGEVESLRLRSVPIIDGKMPRKGAVIKKRINENADSVHAYVVFKTEESAQASLTHNMALVGGNHIRVDMACPPRKKIKGDNTALFDNKRTVFIGNLPFDVKDEEIYKTFSTLKNLESSIEGIRVIRDPGTNIGKGIAYVLFNSMDAVNLVVKKRNLKIRDRVVRISRAKSMETSFNPRSFSTEPEFSAKRSGVKSNTSYQGLRGSKSGAHSKIPLLSKSRSQSASQTKVRMHKRPSVAARKERALMAAKFTGIPGSKRKFGDQSRTPQSYGKKLRKFE